MSPPPFPETVDFSVQNAKTRLTYRLIRSDALEPTPERLAEITEANNEPAIYRWIWQDRLDGAPYPPEKAAEFLEWAREGWQAGSHFVFALLATDGALAAALDIKSPDLDAAEIGYWQRAAHAGSMTNAVTALCGLARATGYASLYARVRPDNVASQAVLKRAGFERQAGTDELNGHAHLRFSRVL